MSERFNRGMRFPVTVWLQLQTCTLLPLRGGVMDAARLAQDCNWGQSMPR